MSINKLSDFYKKFEKYISPVGLIYGFIFTSLTLTRVDTFLENFWIVIHLLLAGFGILAMTLLENRAEKKKLPIADQEKFHFYLTLVIQFAFGNLFSTFLVFYMRSTSFSDSWLFLLALLVLLIGNELWKKHYQRLAFQVIILFISLYLFLVFLLPVLSNRLGTDLFIAAGILSLAFTFLFTLILKKYAEEKFKKGHTVLGLGVATVFILMNLLYFTNVIPPIPLSLKATGVYHSLVSTKSGDYQVRAEPASWLNYFDRYPVFHRLAGEPVYVFNAIFSPTSFDMQIIHQWQYYDEVKKDWFDSSKVTLPIEGGREGGYRTYSFKQAVTPGLWRVRVMTVSGQVLGTVRFEVERATTASDLVDKIL